MPDRTPDEALKSATSIGPISPLLNRFGVKPKPKK